jgi:hypothetical protein
VPPARSPALSGGVIRSDNAIGAPGVPDGEADIGQIGAMASDRASRAEGRLPPVLPAPAADFLQIIFSRQYTLTKGSPRARQSRDNSLYSLLEW